MLSIQKLQKYFQTRRHKRLVSLFDLPKESTVLDISCGEGDILAILNTYTSGHIFHGIDMQEKNIEQAKMNYPWGKFVVARAESLPYENNQFTAVISCVSLHHYDNAQKVFEEVSRVLGAGGIFYIIDLIPNYRWSQILHNLEGCPEPYHFEKYYLLKDIEILAASVGLSLITDKLTNPLSFSGLRILAFKKC